MLGPEWLNPQSLLESLGPWALVGILLIVFAECGLLLGFFLPGDSLLFTAGLLVATNVLDVNIVLLCALITIAAVLGNICGYWLGHKLGPAVFRRPDSRLFRQEHVERTRRFFEGHGARSIVLARFLPIVRTFITVMAGVAGMNLRAYLTYSAIGAVLWGTGVTLLGYYLGEFAFVKDHIELIIVGMVLLSFVPVLLELRRAKDITPPA